MYTTMNTFKETLQLVANMEQLRSHDIFVCIIISRGSSDSVFCIDKSFPGFPLDKVKNFFTGHSCPHLVGKPKLFFVQNYIVQKIEESGDMIEVDGPVYASFVNEQTAQRNPKVPIEADIFWSHCKVNEIFLLESPNSPSLYFKHLSQLLSDEQKRKQVDLLDIHTELTGIIYSKQKGFTVYQRHTLTKKLFLYPCLEG